MTDKPKRTFKPINVTNSDWDEYNQTAMALSVERGERISIPAVLREAFDNYMKVI